MGINGNAIRMGYLSIYLSIFLSPEARLGIFYGILMGNSWDIMGYFLGKLMDISYHIMGISMEYIYIYTPPSVNQ